MSSRYMNCVGNLTVRCMRASRRRLELPDTLIYLIRTGHGWSSGSGCKLSRGEKRDGQSNDAVVRERRRGEKLWRTVSLALCAKGEYEKLDESISTANAGRFARAPRRSFSTDRRALGSASEAVGGWGYRFIGRCTNGLWSPVQVDSNRASVPRS